MPQLASHRAHEKRHLGIGARLLVPSESLGQLASSYPIQPPLTRDVRLGRFAAASVSSPAMVAWAFGPVLRVLLLALCLFRTRELRAASGGVGVNPLARMAPGPE